MGSEDTPGECLQDGHTWPHLKSRPLARWMTRASLTWVSPGTIASCTESPRMLRGDSDVGTG